MTIQKTYRTGIVLAGDAGTRPHVATAGRFSQMRPVNDKRLIYPPLNMLTGIRDIPDRLTQAG